MAGLKTQMFQMAVILLALLAFKQVECAKKRRPTQAKKDPGSTCIPELLSVVETQNALSLDRIGHLENGLSNSIDHELDQVKSTIDVRFGVVSEKIADVQTKSEKLQADVTKLRTELTELATLMTSSCDNQPNLSAKLDAVLHLLGAGNTVLPGSLLMSDRPKDCYDIMRLGHTTSGLYTVYVEYLTAQFPVEIFCDMETEDGGWLVFQRRENGETDFERTWDEYKDGFGNKSSEFWLGNEFLHLVTKQRHYTVRFDIWDMSDNHAYAQYDLFTVASGDNFYRMNFACNSYTGTAGDSMEAPGTSHGTNGMFFTTKDKDNDRWATNCASGVGGPWWNNDCNFAVLNGPYGVDGNQRGFNWYHWKKAWVALKKSEIKLRPINAGN